MLKRLTSPAYWDRVWEQTAPESRRGKWRRFLFVSRAERQFWREILPRFLRPAPARVIELGSAPGRALLRWRELFGYDVFGVDISHSGWTLQRDLFARHNLDESHSIHADFLDPAFQSQHGGAYDVVSSAGLIEHFSDPREAVRAHAALLRPGGLLVVSIPNFAGFYRHLVSSAYVALHNLQIMELARFRALFDFPDLEVCFCGYYGGVNLGLAYDRESRFTRSLLRLQVIANLLMHALPVRETRWVSPYLLFIGRKVMSPTAGNPGETACATTIDR